MKLLLSLSLQTLISGRKFNSQFLQLFLDNIILCSYIGIYVYSPVCGTFVHEVERASRAPRTSICKFYLEYIKVGELSSAYVSIGFTCKKALIYTLFSYMYAYTGGKWKKDHVYLHSWTIKEYTYKASQRENNTPTSVSLIESLMMNPRYIFVLFPLCTRTHT